MDVVKYVAVVATGLTVSACDGSLDGYSSTSGQAVYASPGYYSSPSYPAYGPYAQPGYVAPYPYQPGYSGVYGYEPGWAGRREGWHEREEHERWGRERGERAFQNDGRRSFNQPRQDLGNVPMAAQPRVAPMVPPTAAMPQVQQNQKLLDQLGFRPNR